MITSDSILKSTEADITPYKGLYLRGKELAELMKENQNSLFYGRTFSAATIAAFAAIGRIPSKLAYLEGDEVKRESGMQTYDVAEIIRWCRLGADRAACVQVLKERKEAENGR